MLQQSDQFQRHVFVRLPYADKYLENEKQAIQIRQELKQQFANPLLQKTIDPRSKLEKSSKR